MSRGRLDKETAARVEKDLPNVLDVRTAALNLQPDFISMGFPPESTIPIATVCLQDATSTLQEARYALLEAIAHIIWHREKSEPPNEKLAVFFAKFYADDAALRMYAAEEHLVNAIINMLEIKEAVSNFKKELKLAKSKSVASTQAFVGNHLVENAPKYEITSAVLRLEESGDWKKTRRYRNDWVHGKPPIIDGMGIEYERRNRLIVQEGSIGISVGGGDEPHYSVEDLLAFMKPALFLLTEAVTETVSYYVDFLGKNQKIEW